MAMSGRVYSWYSALLAAMCMVLYGFDASVFNSVQASDNWLAYFDLDKDEDTQLIGLINTAYTIGAIVAGFFIGGPLADFAGRRIGMGAGCLVTIIAAFMQAFAPRHNLGVFIAGRVIIGLGQGMALTAGPVYINEITPAEIRGVVMTFWQLNFSVGSFIAYWINYACSLRREELGDWDWRMVVLFQILVPTIVCTLLWTIPESPRWYIQKNKPEKAHKAICSLRNSQEEAEQELLTIREAIEYEKEAISTNYTALFKDPSVRKRLFLTMILNVGQQLTGQGTLNNYSTAIYRKVWPDTRTINLINALNGTFGILFTLNAMWTADRYGRRWLFMVGAIGMGLCMLLVPVVSLATPELEGGVKSQSVGIAIVFLLFLFAFFYKPSWGATVWIYTAEVFSMNIRAQAVGMCSQSQNVANTIFQQFFPTFLKNTGLKCLFFFMAVNFLLVAYVWFFIPETKKVPLEEIDVLFGGANHVEKGSQLVSLGPETTTKDAAIGEQTLGKKQDGETRQVYSLPSLFDVYKSTSGGQIARESEDDRRASDHSSSVPIALSQHGIGRPFEDKEKSRLFMHYINDLSMWVDVCDVKRHFGTEVPKRACHSPLLAYSIIALASRSLCSIAGTDDSKPSTYYSHALQYLIPILDSSFEALNEEVLAAIVILRQYEEMTDSDFGVHLSGSSKLLNSMFSLASKGGLGEAASWIVLRQDYWVALVKSQPMSINLDSYKGSSSFVRTEPECLANRAVFLCAQAIAYAFQPAAIRDLDRWNKLNQELGNWLISNPWHADPLWVEPPHTNSANGSAFPTIWMTHPAHVVGYQHYSLARMVLHIFNPYLSKPSLDTFKKRRESEKAVLDNFRVLLGLAMSNPSVVNAGFTASHTLRACGVYLTDPKEQQESLEFLRKTHLRTGWLTKDLIEQLTVQWSQDGSSSAFGHLFSGKA
ncbi:Quinate permease [Colletotrichum siamense]|nr:Quinate permease [Colletotrichum siamense]